MIEVDLFVATGCHLCPPAVEAATSVVAESDMADVRLRIIDIDGDLALERRYRELIPVLVVDGRDVARFAFDAVEVRREIDRARDEAARDK